MNKDTKYSHASGEAIGYSFLLTFILGFFTYVLAISIEHWYGWVGVFLLLAATLLIGSAVLCHAWRAAAHSRRHD